jgi:hypothetical protein
MPTSLRQRPPNDLPPRLVRILELIQTVLVTTLRRKDSRGFFAAAASPNVMACQISKFFSPSHVVMINFSADLSSTGSVFKSLLPRQPFLSEELTALAAI